MKIQLELDYKAHNYTDTSKSAFNNKKDKLTKREQVYEYIKTCLLYTSPSPRDKRQSRMPSSA